MKILVIGENLIDLFEKGEMFEAHVGGAPLNVAVGLARLGEDVSYLTKFSTDFFASKIVAVLEKERIDTSFCPVDENLRTTLSFAFVNEKGIPSFEIWNRMSADGALNWSELSKVELSDFDIIHFGSILLSTPAAKNVIRFVRKAKEAGKRVFFDPNYRPKVAVDEKEYIELLKEGLEIADVVKCSFEDLQAIFGFLKVDESLRWLIEVEKPIFMTVGDEGAYAVYKRDIHHFPAYTVEVTDTTGCGDAFAAGLIHSLGRVRFPLKYGEIAEAVRFAQAVAALTARKIGALDSLPSKEETLNFLKGGKGIDKS